MFDGEAGLVRGFRLLLMAYVVFMTLEVVIVESIFDAANTVGVVGIAGLIPGASVYYLGDRSTQDPAARVEHLQTTLEGIVWGTGLMAWGVLEVQPFDEGEHTFNLLTLAGVAIVLFYAFMATVGAKRLLR